MLNTLLASASWILDVIFFLVLVGGIAVGVKRGFVNGICKLAGTLFAIAFAFFFCVSMENFLENLFHMRTAISNGLLGCFTSEMMTTPIGANDVTASLEAAGVPGFIASMLSGVFAGAEIPDGTTPAMLIAPLLAKWISIAISFVLLIVLLKLGTWLAGKVLSSLIDKIPVVGTVNHLLGGVLGLVKALILLFIVFAILSWIPAPGLQSFIAESGIVGKIIGSEWFKNAVSYVASFQWYEDYIAQFLQA